VDEGGNLQPATTRRYNQSAMTISASKDGELKLNILGVSHKSFDILIAPLKLINHEVVQLTLVSRDLTSTSLLNCYLLDKFFKM
jgi:hypothetical protein